MLEFGARGMTGLLRRLHAVLDEFNAAIRGPQRLLPPVDSAAAPAFRSCLDAGSGSGDPARLLAGRADRVCGSISTR